MSSDATKSFHQGVAAYSAGSYETAIEFFTAAITHDATLVKAYDARAKAFEKVGRSRDALLDAKRVIERLPTSFRGYLLAGQLWKKLGMTMQAERMLELAKIKCKVESKEFKIVEEELNQVRELAEEATAKSGSSSPILRLPAELLLHVLAMARDSETSKPSSAPSNPIVIASHVCRQWRSLVINAPTLWNTLYIDCALHGPRAVDKAKLWAARATGRIPDGDDEMTVSFDARRGPGITSLTLLGLEHVTPRIELDVLTTFEQMDAVPTLRSLACSWHNPRQIELASRQLQMLFRFLVKHSTMSLRSLSLHTLMTQLHVRFSLPRFCKTFVALQTLEMRSARASAHGRALILGSDFLPEYENEKDWPPARIEKLVLVHPVWRLLFADDTTAAPIITPSDLPRLKHLEVGPTTPSSTWPLFSTPGLRSLKIIEHLNHPSLPDPEMNKSFPELETVIIESSKNLVARFLGLMVEKNVSFTGLRALRITPMTVSTPIMALFGRGSAPNLETLRLPNSTCSHLDEIELPTSFPNLKNLELSNCAWVKNEHLLSLADSAPRLERLKLSQVENGISRGLMKLVQERAAGLKELDLVGCKGVEPKALEWVQKQFVRGRVVKFSLAQKESTKVWREVGV